MRGRNPSYRRAAGPTAIVAAALVATAPAIAGDNPRLIDRADYAIRCRALWMGQSIANWTGLRTEGLVNWPPFLTDAAWNTSPFPDRPWIYLDTFYWGNPWGADDDTDIEYVYLHALHTLGSNRLTPAQIAQKWTDHINSYIWVSNASARALMSVGVRPPMTALAQGLDLAAPADNSLMIDAQLTTEFFGTLCPSMPERALAMADLPIRTTARGHAAHAAQFHVVLYSLASQVDRSLTGRQQAVWLVTESRKYIPDPSKAADVIDFILTDFLGNPDVTDWESTRDKVYQRYQANAAANGFVYRAWYESSINLATSVMCLLYGEMDFERTIRIGTLSGWDSDNGTATMGGLVAFVQGQSFLNTYGWVSDNYWITRTRDNLPDYTPPSAADGEDTFTLMGRRMLPIIDREVLAAGGLVDAAVQPIPAGTWLLPPGGAGAAITKPIALARTPTQHEFLRSANWQVRLAGGAVTPSVSVPGAPDPGYGAAGPALIADGLEHDWRGLEEQGAPRGYTSTQRPAGNPPATPQTFGVEYDRPVEVHTIRFIGGRHFTGASGGGPITGGWYQAIMPQVLIGGIWTTPVLSVSPGPSPADQFAILDFVLDVPLQATGIRVRGLPGGTGAFVTCMELDAFAAPPASLLSSFDLNSDGRVGIDDLYAAAIAPMDLNADGQANEADQAYLEQAARFGEVRSMAARP